MGLSPVKMITGAPYNGQARLYSILAANVNAFAIGDPVATDAGGGSVEGIAAVTLGAAGAAWRGVIVGIFDTKPGIAKIDDPNTIYRPAGAKTKDWYALVVDDPDILFEIQEIGTGTALTVADIGFNADAVAGANNGFVSGWQLNNVGEAVTATLNLRIMELVQRIDNEVGPFAKWLVKINNHELNAGTVGI
jgi:hypothetical protein